MNDSDTIYQVYNKSLGAFVDSTFIPGITNQIKFVRSIFEYSDLVNNTNPLNFANNSMTSGFNVTINSINKSIFDNIKYDGVNYYVNIDESISYLSDNINYTFSVIRSSDLVELWNGSGIVVPGESVKLILPGVNSPAVDQLVNIVYTFTINDLARIVIDYNKGDLFVDYTYVADEIIVSYEAGDNVLDFRNTSNKVSIGSNYYVSYKVGALRDSLLKNFGTLVNVEELNNFDIDFNRERYRDALTAALSSFIQGPTVGALKNIGKTISHIQPEVSESVFENWSLGNSLLYPESVDTTGEFTLLPAHFGNGVLIDSDQTIKLPVNSNFRLEEGTFESWIIPQFNGLDNDADVTFSILKDGYAIESTEVFIGSSEYHPEIISGEFTLNKDSNIIGLPNTNKDGVFIYYNKDATNSYDRWYVRVVDGYIDGVVDGYAADYKITLKTNGKFYDAKSTILPKPSNMKTTTGIRNITVSITRWYCYR